MAGTPSPKPSSPLHCLMSRSPSAWNVVIVRSCAASPSTPKSRWRNVAAAAVVKVIASIVAAATPRCSTRYAMRPASTVVLPLPGPARMLSGPSPASTTSRWLGEKWRMSKRAPAKRRQFLRSAAVTGQLGPAKQEGGVEQVVQRVPRAVRRRDACYQSELFSPCVVASEEGDWTVRVAQHPERGVDRHVRKDVGRTDVTADLG